MLRTRIFYGTAMLAAFFCILLFDFIFDSDIGLGVLTIFVGGTSLLEFYNLVEKKDFRPFRTSGIIAGIVIFMGIWLSAYQDGISKVFPCLFIFIIIFLFSLQALRQESEGTVKNVSVTLFGIIYTFFPLSFIMLIRHMPNGLSIVLMVLLITKGCDIGGYFFGSKFGKHKFSFFSPNKTIEGAVFGLFCSLAIAIVLNALPGMRVLPFPLIILFGLLVGASGIFGDVIESMMKRDIGVKDTGSVIPAFGGILDIIDALIISIPIAYYFLIITNYA